MQDLYQAITDQIIAALEAGTKPWACAWDRSGGLPYNLSTAAPYQGINVLLLWMAAMRKGYRSSAWLTYRQAKAMGGQVRRGEKAVCGIFYKLRDLGRRDEADAAAGAGSGQRCGGGERQHGACSVVGGTVFVYRRAVEPAGGAAERGRAGARADGADDAGAGGPADSGRADE